MKRILVAGIGNIFLGDDGFGVEVVRRLAKRALPAGVEIADFGIRGMDLAYALMDGYDAVIMVDIASRSEAPGTLYLIQVQSEEGQADIDTHGMDPVKVLNLARELGAEPIPTYVVACEPQTVIDGAQTVDVIVELTEPVRQAIDKAVELVEATILNIIGADSELEVGQKS